MSRVSPGWAEDIAVLISAAELTGMIAAEAGCTSVPNRYTVTSEVSRTEHRKRSFFMVFSVKEKRCPLD